MIEKTPIELDCPAPDSLTARSPMIRDLLTAARVRLGSAFGALSGFQRRTLTTIILAIALLPSARLAWRARDMPLLGSMSDDGIYLVCAKSLAEGTGYRILSLPDQPF